MVGYLSPIALRMMPASRVSGTGCLARESSSSHLVRAVRKSDTPKNMPMFNWHMRTQMAHMEVRF